MPVVSTVTWQISGTVRPAAAIARWRADDRRLGLQQVLAGLDDQRVGAAGDQAGGVAPGRRRAASRRARGRGSAAWCRGRSSRARSAGRSGVDAAVGDLAGEPGAGLGQLEDPVGDAVLAEVGRGWRRRCWSRRVGPGREVGVVDAADHVRPGDVEDLVAALVALRSRPGSRSAACSIVPIAPSATTDPLGRVVRKRRSTLRGHGRQAVPGAGSPRGVIRRRGRGVHRRTRRAGAPGTVRS